MKKRFEEHIQKNNLGLPYDQTGNSDRKKLILHDRRAGVQNTEKKKNCANLRREKKVFRDSLFIQYGCMNFLLHHHLLSINPF